MVFAAVAVLSAALSAAPAVQLASAPPADECEYRIYYLPFPPDENGRASAPPAINGEREKDDSFVVTVNRKICPAKRLLGVGANKRWIEEPGQHTVTWSATVTPTKADQAAPPTSYLKGPTFRIGPDGETVLEQRQ